jgi:hypothetical protein
VKKFTLLMILGVVAGAALAFLFLYLEFHDNSEELSPFRPVLDPASEAGKQG